MKTANSEIKGFDTANIWKKVTNIVYLFEHICYWMIKLVSINRNKKLRKYRS